MEIVEKIQHALDEITSGAENIIECSIINRDGFNIVSSSVHKDPIGLDGNPVSSLLNKANLLTQIITGKDAEKIFIKYDEKSILLSKLSDNIVLCLLLEKRASQPMVLLDIKSHLSYLKKLVENY